MLQAIPYHLGAFFARLLPMWACVAITWTIGELNWRLRPGTRRLVAENLGIIHPEWTLSERRRLARRVVHEFARSILLFLQMPFLEPAKLFARCDLTALRAEIDRLGPNRPFIIATGHIGPWELGGYCLKHLGYQVHTVALDHPSAEVTKFFSARRAYLGVRAHPLHGSFPALKEALDRGEIVALLIDRSYAKAGKRFRFFGREAEFPLGHLVLSARARVPILTGALVFDGRDRFRYVHGGTYSPDEALNDFDQLDALQEHCLRDLERIIRAHSDQWFHFLPLARTEEHGD
jgi:Kdo2-lipid IVA lauroyltransferase/acyltransferase